MTDTQDTTTDIDLTGIGEHRPDRRRGFLVFASLPPAVQNAEDSTAFCDFENRRMRARICRIRPSTPAERALLCHVLGRAVPENLETTVRWLSSGVRNRSWPALKITEEGELK